MNKFKLTLATILTLVISLNLLTRWDYIDYDDKDLGKTWFLIGQDHKINPIEKEIETYYNPFGIKYGMSALEVDAALTRRGYKLHQYWQDNTEAIYDQDHDKSGWGFLDRLYINFTNDGFATGSVDKRLNLKDINESRKNISELINEYNYLKFEDSSKINDTIIRANLDEDFITKINFSWEDYRKVLHIKYY